MRFTKSSEKLMKYFLKDFDKFCDKKKPETQSQTDRILKILYQDIKLCDIYIDTLYRRNLIHETVRDIKYLSDLPKTHLLTAIPKGIKMQIDYSSIGYIKVNTTMLNLNITIYFLLFKKSDFNQLNKIKEKVKQALKIIRFCSLYMKKDHMDSLTVYLYLSSIKKELPKSQIAVLDKDHCNSGVTFACQEKGELLIYREEEWQKVLIHEIFHCMCLDFSGIEYPSLKNNIKKIFNVESDFELSEAYTEFWATIINCCRVSYNLLDDMHDEESFYLFTEFCIQFEKLFSLFQCVNILQYMGLRYNNLYKKSPLSIGLRKLLYKEKTNVLCYYVIKLILLYNSDDFLTWCLLNNSNILAFDKSPGNLRKFGKFIEEHYDNKRLTNSIADMEVLYYDVKKSCVYPYSKDIMKTSRITICELT